jgi:hypothetical protein
LQQRKKAHRWILKAPAHLFALPALLSIYPDARFIQTHRDPLEAIASVSSFITILRRVFSWKVDPQEIAREAWRYWSETLAKFTRDRDLYLSADRICDLRYTDIRRDPMAAVRSIYSHFRWPLPRPAEERIAESLARQPREQNGFHRYRLSEFGLEAMDRERDFGTYCARFGLGNDSSSQTARIERALVF